MRILDRHIAQSIIRIFIATILIFCFLYILVDITSNLDEYIDSKVSKAVMLQYYLTYIPVILVQTSPIASLIAVLFTFSGLNNDNEIIVMRASGLSFWQITRPAIIFGLVSAAFIFWMNESFAPRATAQAEKIQNEYIILKADRKKKKQEQIKNLTFYGLKNRLYFVDTFDPNAYELKGVTIVEHDGEQRVTQKIVALKGVWTGIAWKFYKCQTTEYGPGGINQPVKIKFSNERLMDIKETPEDFLKQRLNVTSMNIRQLNEYMSRFENSGAAKAINNLQVDIQQKLAFPVGNFVIILMGLPFALMIKSRRRSTITALGIAIIIGFLYYVVNAVALAFGKAGFLSPFLAAWATPLFFTLAAIALIENNF